MAGDPYCATHGFVRCNCEFMNRPMSRIEYFEPIKPEDLMYQEPKQRKYLPTLAELIDRLSIVQLKEIYNHKHRAEYSEEIQNILHDIQICLDENPNPISAEAIRAIVVLAQTNLNIWTNEDNCRKGVVGENNLELTHGLNGVRNTAKNKVQEAMGGRKDYKINCLGAEFKDWEISWNENKDD